MIRAWTGPILLLGAWLAGCSDDAPQSSSRPPHILLVSVDTLRADHLSCYGYERPTSPRLDAFAQEGVLFERAWSTSSWTLPAHLSLLTGLFVSSHGVCDDRLWTRRDEQGEPVPPPLRGRFVSEALSDAGYATAGFYTWKYLERQFGFGPGFDQWERLGHRFWSHPVVGPEFERLRAAGDTGALRALADAHPALFDDTLPSSEEVLERALTWLDTERDTQRPFFLFLHLFDVHDPYTPPAPFDTRFDPDYTGPIDGRRVTAADSDVHGGMAARDLEHLVALYDGEIAWVDSILGRLFDALDERGLEQDTLVIVTADHGEEFFEHGHKTHRRQLFSESTHVPLILRWPAALPAGLRIDSGVGLVDIAATLGAAAGVPGWQSMQGTDLLPLARGEPAEEERTYLAELLLFDGSAVPLRQAALARGDSLTLLEARGAEPWSARALDLAQDPRGRGAGAALDPGALEGLRERIAQLGASSLRLRADLLARSTDLPALSEHDRKQLASMGYSSAEAGEGTLSGVERACVEGCVWPDE